MGYALVLLNLIKISNYLIKISAENLHCVVPGPELLWGVTPPPPKKKSEKRAQLAQGGGGWNAGTC